jgi:hypothetical protein
MSAPCSLINRPEPSIPGPTVYGVPGTQGRAGFKIGSGGRGCQGEFRNTPIRIRRDRSAPESNGRLPVDAIALLLHLHSIFSAVAPFAQWELHRAALLSPMMVSNSPFLGGMLLVGAGVFRFTPLKRACLAHCCSPLGFFMTGWREGMRGAFLMGIRHGIFCVGF